MTKVVRNSSRFYALFLLAMSLLLVVHPAGFFSVPQANAQPASTPSGLAFTTPAQTLAARECSSTITVQAQNSTGSPSNVTVATTVFLATNSSTGAFYSTNACSTAITSVSIAAGANSASFFYEDTAVGTATITATAAGLTSASQNARIVTKIAIDPPAIASLNYGSTSTFSVVVNVTNAPAMNSFRVSVQFNPKVLQVVRIDFSSSSSYVLGQSAAAYYECIGVNSLIGGSCTDSIDQAYAPGVLTLGASILGTTTGGPTSGPLFSVNFEVVRQGFSEIHLLGSEVVGCNSSGICGLTPVTTRSFDGYFSDITCYQATLCTPPIARVTYAPSIVLTGKPIFFNANESYATNPGAAIIKYSFDWTAWGEGIKITSNSTIRHTFAAAANKQFTLLVNDTYGITGSVSVLINVVSVYISVGVGSVNINPLTGVTPGTPVNIVVTAVNHSTLNENVSLHVILDPGGSQMKDLQDREFLNLTALTSAPPFTIVWDTTNYVPRIYVVMVSVDPVAKQTDTSGLTAVSYIQLVSSQPTAGLSLTVVSGIGVAVSLALLFGLGSLGRIFRKKPVDEDLV